MRIGFIIPNLLPFGGNTGTVMSYVSQASKTCEEVVLFQSYKFKDNTQYPLDFFNAMPNVRVITLHIPWYKVVDSTRNIPFGYLIHYALYPIFVLLRKISNYRKFKYAKRLDGIYSFDFIDTDIFPIKNMPIIVGTHNQKMSYLKVTAINSKILLRRARGIRLFESERIYCSKFSNKVAKVIPKGVNTDLFYPRNSGNNPKVKFLYVARLEPKKGIDILLESWDKYQGWVKGELNIVGTGSLTYMVQNNRLKGVVYHGPLYGRDLQELYRECDVFVFPTQWDAQPSVIVEAISSGLEVLCSDYLKGVFDDFEKEGYLRYVRNNSNDLSQIMKEYSERIWDNFTQRKEMHDFVDKVRSQKIEVDEILSFMKSLVNSS